MCGGAGARNWCVGSRRGVNAEELMLFGPGAFCI